MKKKRYILMLSIIGVILLGGISYAFFNYYKESANSQFVSGNIYLKLDDETDSISLPNAFPQSKEKARRRDDNTLTFTVKGKNTSSKDVMYSIELNNGADSQDDTKSRFDAEDLLFDLVEIDGNTRTYLINALGYEEFNHTKIWDEIVRKDTNSEISHTYELRVWINQDVSFGEGEGVKYTSEEYANKYATIKIAVSGNLLDDEYYKVTFDGQGGEVKRAYYYTKIGEKYDNLYAPEREGYTFLGWNGKNLLNYNQLSKIAKDSGITVSNDGYISDITSSVDDRVYDFLSSNWKTELETGNYTLSLVFSTKSVQHEGQNRGMIFDLNDNSVIPAMELENVENVKSTFTLNNNIKVGIVIKGYNGVYRIQLEQGSNQTVWEPFYITENVGITQNNEHELRAIWDSEPELYVSKETYLEQDLSTFGKGGNVEAIKVDNGIVTFNTLDCYIFSSFFDVENDYWYLTFDAYTTGTISSTNVGGGNYSIYLYDSNHKMVENVNNISNMGFRYKIKPNEWQNNISILRNKFYLLYGSNIKYVKIYFTSEHSMSSAPLLIRNVKVHGQMSNSFYIIKLDASDDGQITELKYAKGEHNASYFNENGTDVVSDEIRVTENGIYTVYAKDNSNNEVVKTIEITNIK